MKMASVRRRAHHELAVWITCLDCHILFLREAVHDDCDYVFGNCDSLPMPTEERKPKINAELERISLGQLERRCSRG